MRTLCRLRARSDVQSDIVITNRPKWRFIPGCLFGGRPMFRCSLSFALVALAVALPIGLPSGEPAKAGGRAPPTFARFVTNYFTPFLHRNRWKGRAAGWNFSHWK